MICTKLDPAYVRACRAARAHARGPLKPGDPRAVYLVESKRAYPAVARTGEDMRPHVNPSLLFAGRLQEVTE